MIALDNPSIVFRKSRLYPLIDFRISVPVELFNSRSSLRLAIAINSDNRKVIIISHSEVSTFEMTAPPFTRNTKPEESIRISRMAIFLSPNEYERLIIKYRPRIKRNKKLGSAKYPNRLPTISREMQSMTARCLFNTAGSQRAIAFYRVFTVVFYIPIIINDINAGGKKTKCNKSFQYFRDRGRDKKLTCEKRGNN